jgi:hypothetical protein
VAGRKFGLVMAAKVPGSYFALSREEQEKPGRAFEEVAEKYAGRVEVLRRYWTSSFTAEVSDVFIMECDDLMDAHSFNRELRELLARDGDPDRFGIEVRIWAGVNPDV